MHPYPQVQTEEQQNRLRVAGLSLKEWTEKFWEWTYQTTDEANPITTVGPARPLRYAGRQPTWFQTECMKEYGESVWFIAPAPYSEPESIIHVYIPEGTWWLLIAPANTAAAHEHYPSLDTIEKLRRHTLHDMEMTYELWTTFDGFSVPWYYVDNTQRLITIKDVPQQKAKNWIHRDLTQWGGTIHTLQAGYWNLIEPISPGEHLLVMHSRSPTYRVDITYELSAAGPSASSSSLSSSSSSSLSVSRPGRVLYPAG